MSTSWIPKEVNEVSPVKIALSDVPVLSSRTAELWSAQFHPDSLSIDIKSVTLLRITHLDVY